MKKNYYKLAKEQIRDKAIEFQITFSAYDYSYSELINKSEYFTKLAKRYGLLREFRENGII